jgi:uncharacterized protein (DUF433 family)
MPLQPDPLPLRADPDGNIYIGSSRILVDDVLTWFKQGISPDQIADKNSTLSRADVYAVIAYYLRHQDEVDPYLVPQQAEAEAFGRRESVTMPRHAEGGMRIETLPANTAMLQALREIEERGKGMHPKKDTRDFLREARAGAMYGISDHD